MSAPVWKGFVISQTDTTYTVLFERDKQQYTFLKKEGDEMVGIKMMPCGNVCEVQDYIIDNVRLFGAIKEYHTNMIRHRERRARRKNTPSK